MAKSNSTNKEKIEHLLSRNVEEVIERKHLEAALLSGKKLRVKLGIDPTGGNVHIGRAVVLWKLKEFQDLGHKILLIIGDFTAQIGDPSDKLAKRPFLTAAQVQKNLESYLPQIGKILDLKKVEVHYNSEWLSKLNFRETAELAETFTVNQMLRRHNFRERWDKGEEISVREFLYPVMQGYDSVMVKADIELGGTDQLFNLMAGREIQKHYGQKSQDIMITKMLVGIDGRKMSTSWGNVINITDSADEIYGKVMSARDDSIVEYFKLATDVPQNQISNYEKILKEKKTNPRDIKSKLAFEIVKRYHGESFAKKSTENFKRIFSKKEVSGVLPELKLKQRNISLLELAVFCGVAKSKSDARRLIVGGAVELAGTVKKTPNEVLEFEGGEILKIGKRHFFRIKVI